MVEKVTEIKIDQDRCKGCDLCLNLCPKSVFKESNELGSKGFNLRVIEQADRCSKCGLCQYFCPEGAISIDGMSPLGGPWEAVSERPKVSAQGRGGWGRAKTLRPGRHLVTGNIACVYAALDAGCRFFAGYPITPATEQLHEMVRLMPSVGGVFIQMENEDSSLAALCGASLAGAKVMTATSDPGFERMLENLSFALVNELPMVIVVAQRTSPSTGRPTGTGSWLVRGTRWGPHGGTEHIVLYPSTVQDVYDETVKAFNLAERFRVPVMLMMEASNAHLEEAIDIPKEIVVFDRIYVPGSPPFGPTEDWAAPSLPRFGDGEVLKVSGLTHNRYGTPCANDPGVHEAMVRHLQQKIASKADELTDIEEYRLDDAEIMIVAYGHTARAARWAIGQARAKGIKVGLLNIRALYPFPDKEIRKYSRTSSCVVVPEMNQGQLFYVVRELSSAPVVSLPQPDGENINPRRLLDFLENMERKYFQKRAGEQPPTYVDPPEWRREPKESNDSRMTFQTPFCAGCGLGILRNCLLDTIKELKLPADKIVIVSGIGCSARLPNHVPVDSANTTHGYPIPFATGVKLYQPGLQVIVVSGDGDLFDIGAGHIVHGARRNLPLTVICVNNFVYGMTGGQASATTPYGAYTASTPDGNKSYPFDLVRLMLGANAKYVARCPISKPLVLKEILKGALQSGGFSFIEVVSPCVTGFGRRNTLALPSKIWDSLNATYVGKDAASKMSRENMTKKFRKLFPFRDKAEPEELVQVVYGHFSDLTEYLGLMPEDKP